MFFSCPMGTHKAEAHSGTGVEFIPELLPAASGCRLEGVVWKDLWKIKALLIIDRLTTRQTFIFIWGGGENGLKKKDERARKARAGEEKKRKEKKERKSKRKQWISSIIYKLQGHWRSVPVSYLHGYFKRKNKQRAPQLPISIPWLSGLWHRPRHGRHRAVRRLMTNSWVRLYQPGSLVLSARLRSRNTGWLLRMRKTEYFCFPL